jgi:hypothetical protein
MASAFTVLETNILKAKGMADEQIATLAAAGVTSRKHFDTVGDADTLVSLVPTLGKEVADKIMEWAVGAPAASEPATTGAAGRLTIDSADAVYCIHCGTKQPKDYKSGDLCVSCGKQAEPILSCYWCAASGPGKFCRACGAEFVPMGELDLAVLLKREGLPKDEVPLRLKSMTQAEKDDLWGRVRRSRG